MSPDAGIGPISVSSSNSSPCTDILFQCSMCKLVSPGKGTSTNFNQPAIPFFYLPCTKFQTCRIRAYL